MAAALKSDETLALNAAAQLLAAGRAQEAADRLAPVITSGSRHPEILMAYSVACERGGKPRDALGACQAALQAAPERADIWANLGRMLHEQGQSAQGAEMLERAVQIDPTKADYWYNLGLAANEAGTPPRATEALREAVRSRPPRGARLAVRDCCRGPLDRPLRLSSRNRSGDRLPSTSRRLRLRRVGARIVRMRVARLCGCVRLSPCSCRRISLLRDHSRSLTMPLPI